MAVESRLHPAFLGMIGSQPALHELTLTIRIAYRAQYLLLVKRAVHLHLPFVP